MSDRLKVMVVFGTRPEAIKMAPVIRELRRAADRFDSVVVVTGQHRDMLDQVTTIFGIDPDYDLDIMKENQSLVGITVAVLQGLDSVIQEERPDALLVHGDTTTSFAAALTSYYHQVSVGHVEAGLRTYDKYRPFPEEMNRHLTGVIADINFAPTEQAVGNLRREGVPQDSIYVTGNTVIDALFSVVRGDEDELPPELEALFRDDERVLLVEAHRRENLGRPMEEICRALADVARSRSDVRIVCAVHRNPRVREVFERVLGGEERVDLIEPPDYRSFVLLMSRSYMVVTDSGGLQEEAPALGKPVLVLREVTERPEAVEAGGVRLIGAARDRVARAVEALLDDQSEYDRMSRAVNPFGDGCASQRIVRALSHHFGRGERPDDYVPEHS